MVYHTPYAEEILNLKGERANGDTLVMCGWKVPPSSSTPEGISYRMALIRKGKRVLGYDNENHGTGLSNHHKHIGTRIAPYTYVDFWTAVEDFMRDVEAYRGEL